MKKRLVIGSLILGAVIVGFLVLPWILRGGNAYIKWAWSPLFAENKVQRTASVVESVIPATGAESKEPAVTGDTTTVSNVVVPVTSEIEFPASTSYTMLFKFSDGTTETIVMGTDFDLEDRTELWDRVKLIGLDDVIVTSDTDLVWFYNGYVAPLPAGENSLGEIWRVAMSNDPLYTAGFSVRTPANGCSATASKGDWGIQAQTTVTKEMADWFVQYCAPSEIEEWYAIRAEMKMPENLWTK